MPQLLKQVHVRPSYALPLFSHLPLNNPEPCVACVPHLPFHFPDITCVCSLLEAS